MIGLDYSEVQFGLGQTPIGPVGCPPWGTANWGPKNPEKSQNFAKFKFLWFSTLKMRKFSKNEVLRAQNGKKKIFGHENSKINSL